LRPRVAQDTPRVANSDEKAAQRGPRDIPKEGKIAKPRKLQHLDFERPYEGLATFTPFGETGRGKKLPKFDQFEHYEKYLTNRAFGLALPLLPRQTFTKNGDGEARDKRAPTDPDPAGPAPPPSPLPGRATPAPPPEQS